MFTQTHTHTILDTRAYNASLGCEILWSCCTKLLRTPLWTTGHYSCCVALTWSGCVEQFYTKEALTKPSCIAQRAQDISSDRTRDIYLGAETFFGDLEPRSKKP